MNVATLAEQLPATNQTREVYAASLSTLYKLGSTGLLGEGIRGAEVLAYDDFETKVSEMLKTDEDYGEYVDIDRSRVFSYEAGKTRAADGTPMVDLVSAGLAASKNAWDDRLRVTQAERDEGDVAVAEMADRLTVGQALIVASVEPKAELVGPDARFWHNMGYRKGVSYLQLYYRSAEDKMLTGTLSIRHSDMDGLRAVFAKRGVHIPEEVTANQFIRHAYLLSGTESDIKDAVAGMRREYYHSMGIKGAISVDDYMAKPENAAFLEGMFTTYYPAIGTALIRRKNHPVLQDFARGALQQIPAEKLVPEVRRELVRIANSSRFDDDMARALDAVIPYAAKEHLRIGLGRMEAKQSGNPVFAGRIEPARPTAVPLSKQEAGYHVSHQQVQHLALAGLSRGVTAGRSGGGCAGVNLAAGGLDGETNPLNPLDVYGGKSEKSDEPDRTEDCDFVSKECPKCHARNVKTVCRGGKYYGACGCSS